MKLLPKERERLRRALRRMGYRSTRQQRQHVFEQVLNHFASKEFEYCIICRQDKRHRRVYGYGNVKPNPVAFGKTWEVVELNGEVTFNSPRRQS